MDNTPPKILLSGPPGCGKTTLVRKVVQKLGIPARGFYTQEVRGGRGERVGFDVVTLDGRRGVLSRAGALGPRIGRYGVDLWFLESEALPAIEPSSGALIVIDEIGKMECLSPIFMEAVKKALDMDCAVLGTVSRGGPPFIREVRARQDVELIEVTGNNRDHLAEEIVHRVESGRWKEER